jgi:putative sterol carrier protein
MATEVFSEEWSQACRESLEARGRYREVGRTWESPVALIMRADPRLGIEKERAVYLELDRGVCRVARVADGEDLRAAEFVLAADAAQWKRMLSGDLDPISAVMFGKLKLERGTLAALLPYAPAARELIAAAIDAGGRFPTG